MISIASNKKKGFTFTCEASYEDVVKAIFACPSSFFFSRNFDGSIIIFEDAIEAIYGPMKTSFTKSDDPVERVYNKKGYRFARLIDNSPAFNSTVHYLI